MAISPSCEREMLFLCCEMKEECLCWKLKDWAFAIRDNCLSLPSVVGHCLLSVCYNRQLLCDGPAGNDLRLAVSVTNSSSGAAHPTVLLGC